MHKLEQNLHDLTNELNQTKLEQMRKVGEVDSLRTRLSQQEGFKAQLRSERDELQNRVVHLEQACRDLHYQL